MSCYALSQITNVRTLERLQLVTLLSQKHINESVL